MNVFKKTLIPVVAAVLSLASCDTGEDIPSSPIYTDVVTVASMSPATVFTMTPPEGSQLVTLTYNGSINKEVFEVGDRVLISYQTDAERYQSGTINLAGIGLTFGEGKPFEEVTSASTGGFVSQEVNRAEAWRSGRYLNVAFTANNNTMPAECRVVLDAETKNDEYPQLYLLYNQKTITVSPETAFYMSYSISGLFDLSGCKGVKFNYTTASGKQQITIENPSSMVRPEK